MDISSDSAPSSETPSYSPSSPDELFDHYESEGNASQPSEETPNEKPEAPHNDTVVDGSAITDETSDESSKVQTEKANAKIFKAKHGDKDLDIPEDAVITERIDGKDVEISVREVLDQYAGKVAYDRKFSELDVKSKQVDQKLASHQTEVSNIQEKFSKIVEAAQAGAGQAAIRLIAELAEKDPIQFEKDYIENFGKFVTEFNKLTPEQKELYHAKQREEFIKSENEKLKAANEGLTSRSQLETQIKSLAQDLGITYDQFGEMYRFLAAHPTNQGKEITAQDVASYHKNLQNYTRIEQVMVELDFDTEANDALMDNVAGILEREPDFTNDDIKDILLAAKLKLNPSDEAVNRKLQAANKSGNRPAGLHSAPSKKPTDSTYEDEDLAYLYRNK